MTCIGLNDKGSLYLTASSWHIFIVSTVRHFWKLGAAVREPGARTRRVQGLGAVVSSLVNRSYHVKHAKVAGTTVTTVLACLQSPASMHKSDLDCILRRAWVEK